MRSATPRFSATLAGLALAIICTAPALADDSEVFTSTTYVNSKGVRPNILFIVDTSGSMNAAEPNFDSTKTYDGPCRKDAVYWRRSNDANEAPPDCLTSPDSQYVDAAANRCAASASSLNDSGVYATARIQQWNPGKDASTNGSWQNLDSDRPSRKIECRADDQVHGDNTGDAANRANNNTTGWSKNNSIDWSNVSRYSLYSGNYANWYYGSDKGSRLTRLEIVTNSANTLIDTLQGVNLGLARYDNDANGGMITVPVKNLDTAQRTALKDTLKTYAPDGFTPLSETLYEAGLYFAGMNADYGLRSEPVLSTPDARNGDTYKSPLEFSCQKNFIVYLTDGLPTEDVGADSKIPAFDPPGDASPLPGETTGKANDFKTVLGGRTACTDTPNPDSDNWDGHGECLDDMAEYLNKADLSGTLSGVQNVTTFVIGFGTEVQSSVPYLKNVAEKGGSKNAYTATNSSGLVTTLQDIFNKVADDANLTFTSPTVSVNAFNRAQNLNDLYVSVFSPNQTEHWDGNLKKYKLVNSTIFGVGPNPADPDSLTPAVDPATGFFYTTTRSFWSSEADGLVVTMGGAASKLPGYAETGTGNRNLYSDITSNAITAATNKVISTNSSLTNAMLNADSDAEADDIILFARGQDFTDVDDDQNLAERNYQMGDPMHARPAVVIYGGTVASPDVSDAVAFVPTNDGYLHAIDTKTGAEKWAFIPKDLLPRQKERKNKATVSSVRTYALDGDVRVFKFDKNRDGIVTTGDGDFVYIYFGYGRGGSAYYALNVTDPVTPVVLWKKTDADLPGLGKAWSTPALTRVEVTDKTQNTDKNVLIFGGGYDPDGQEDATVAYAPDSKGNRLFMLDAVSGALLWSAGPKDSGASLELTSMTNSIPADITVVDTDGNGIADRMYAGDMGGRIWRFDITSGSAEKSLVTGGVFASLGSADQATPVRADNRRFYYAPDVALISTRGAKPYYNLAVGSGYRGHPLEVDTHDRFYSLRDYNPFGKVSQDDYNKTDRRIIKDGDTDLNDATTTVDIVVKEGDAGWKLQLQTTAGAWKGEKVLAEAITVGGVILFPTFQPDGQQAADPCLPATLNRVYAVRADNARPFADNNRDGDKSDVADRAGELKQGGIAAGISVIVDNGQNSNDGAACKAGEVNCVCKADGTNCHIEDPGSTCLAGVEVLKTCVPVGGTVRTFWQRK